MRCQNTNIFNITYFTFDLNSERIPQELFINYSFKRIHPATANGKIMKISHKYLLRFPPLKRTDVTLLISRQDWISTTPFMPSLS